MEGVALQAIQDDEDITTVGEGSLMGLGALGTDADIKETSAGGAAFVAERAARSAQLAAWCGLLAAARSMQSGSAERKASPDNENTRWILWRALHRAEQDMPPNLEYEQLLPEG